MKSPSSVPERVLVIGQAGSGKSECGVQLARQMRLCDDDHKVLWINCDTAGSVARCNERYDDWTNNILHFDARDWRSLTEATALVTQLATQDDWVIIDSMEQPWEWVRDAYIEQRERKAGRIPDFQVDPFAVVNTEIEGPEYNTAINPAYKRWLMPLLNDLPAHLLLTSPAQPIKVPVEKNGKMTWGDEAQTISTYGQYGVRPAGQKHQLYQVHTTLLAKMVVKQGTNTYSLTTMSKDRSRPMLDEVQLPEEGGFPLVYLAGCAGWQL